MPHPSWESADVFVLSGVSVINGHIRRLPTTFSKRNVDVPKKMQAILSWIYMVTMDGGG